MLFFLLINKSDRNPASRLSEFVYHLYDYRPNCTITISILITNLNSSRSRRDEFFIYRSALPFFNAENELECNLTFCRTWELSFTSNLNSPFFSVDPSKPQIHFHDTWRYRSVRADKHSWLPRNFIGRSSHFKQRDSNMDCSCDRNLRHWGCRCFRWKRFSTWGLSRLLEARWLGSKDNRNFPT